MEDLVKTYDYLKQFLTEERLRKIEHFAPESSDYVLPVLEDVYQFRNAAAVVRSTEACAFHKVVALQEEYSFEPNLRVTKGADTWVEVEKLPRNMASFQKIKDRGYKMVAVSLENNAKFLPEYEITQPVALIFGTEMEGVSQEILDFADETLAIPMYGFTRSFNVSVAASICLYELKQKLMKSGIDYKLNEEKLLRMKIRWAVNSMRSGDQIFEKYLRDNNINFS